MNDDILGQIKDVYDYIFQLATICRWHNEKKISGGQYLFLTGMLMEHFPQYHKVEI